MSDNEELLGLAESLLDLLIARATGTSSGGGDYRSLREQLLANPATRSSLPRFVFRCRNLDQFWGFIQPKFPTYKERRAFLTEQFEPLFAQIEGRLVPPQDEITAQIKNLDSDEVLAKWEGALARLPTDPEGAITLARTLLESVCRVILEEESAEVGDRDDLPRLYKRCPPIPSRPAYHPAGRGSRSPTRGSVQWAGEQLGPPGNV